MLFYSSEFQMAWLGKIRSQNLKKDKLNLSTKQKENEKIRLNIMKLIWTQRDYRVRRNRMWLDWKLSGVPRMNPVPITIHKLYPSLEANLTEVHTRWGVYASEEWRDAWTMDITRGQHWTMRRAFCFMIKQRPGWTKNSRQRRMSPLNNRAA